MPKKDTKAGEPVKDPLWYKNAVIYQGHVRAFCDSSGNGVGDFTGLTAKLPYLQDLGITAIWLLPFYPSPLRDDGYDIADYYSIHPDYGTLRDFKTFLREAHRRGLRVITELVINHTSDQHPWFQRARRASPGSRWRDFYVWNDNDEKYAEARIIFKDFETSNWTWDPVANAYFWHRFYSHQPDLNFENPQVQKEIFKVMDFWLGMGVDGLRLDAVPYLYESEGTDCENLPQTHEFLKKLRRHIDEKHEDRMLLAEANQWPEYAVAYFGQGKGDECHVAFHFPLMPRLFMGIRMEDRVPLVDIMEQTPAIPETSQWALFLRNHDELTLEMVTDEERDYMYRMYAEDPKARINLGIRRRLAPLLENDRKRIELLNALLFSLPGTPVLYYGDEIGMGDNIFLGDRNGVRTPMHWSSDKNAGFSRCNPQGLYLPVIVDPEYHYETVNVEAHQSNPQSLLWWMKRLLAARKHWKAFGQGTVEFLRPENRKVLAYIRRYDGETLLIVANLSRFPQPVSIDLPDHKHLVPVEVFGRTEFPEIDGDPYFLSMGPYAFYWFSLEPSRAKQAINRIASGARELRTIEVPERWENILEDRKAKNELEAILPDYVQERRWFGGKTKPIKSISITDSIPIPLKPGQAFITLIRIDYVQGESDTYLLPLAFTAGATPETFGRPQWMIASLNIAKKKQTGILHDGIASVGFNTAVLDAVSRRRTFTGDRGQITTSRTPVLKRIQSESEGDLEPSVGKAEQSNSGVIYGQRLILKLFRRLDKGINPDLEIGRFLTEKGFPNIAPVAGALEYKGKKGPAMSLGFFSKFISGGKDAWEYTLDEVARYYERIQSLLVESPLVPSPLLPLSEFTEKGLPAAATETIGSYLETARLLGERTAELHRALASDSENKDFAPEPFTPFYQRSLYQSMRNLFVQNLELLRRMRETLPEAVQGDADKVISLEGEILNRFRLLTKKTIRTVRIRCHGDFHLGQVLYTGKDFIILDFEGEPARSLSERRIKRPPMRDVGGMIRSFQYAAHTGLAQHKEAGSITEENLPKFKPWAHYWEHCISAAFLGAYVQATEGTQLIPTDKEEFKVLLEASLIEKAVYELSYELNNRPAWAHIPLRGILELVES
ncbi:MAG: maltose alpha-D-glucosyltransferase [Opitutales bacterium]